MTAQRVDGTRPECTCTATNPCSEDEPTGCPVCDHLRGQS